MQRSITVTVANAAPTAAHTPFPADGADEIEPGVALSWEPATDLNCDTLHYTLALGADGQPLSIVATGLLTPTWSTNNLQLGSHYQWTITATDGISSTAGPVWSFSTTLTPRHMVFLPLVLREE